MLAFCTLGGVGSNTKATAAIAAAISLAIAMVGLDKTNDMPRFTFGELHLMDGVDFIVAIVDLFAEAKVLHFIETHGGESAGGVMLGKITID